MLPRTRQRRIVLAVSCALAVLLLSYLLLYHAAITEGMLEQYSAGLLYPSSRLENGVNTSSDTFNHSSDHTHTTIPRGAHSHGFTLFDNLYLRNGTFYVLTPDPLEFPPRRWLLALPLERGKEHSLEPSEQELSFIDPDEGTHILGNHAIRIEGLTVIVYDVDQFMHHYYHWWGEIILGFWRVYSKLSAGEDGSISSLPFPARFILPFVNDTWRDKAGMDGPLMRAAFPLASIETADYWKDLLRLNVTVVFERAMIINREAAHLHPFGGVWFKMIAGTMNVTVPDGFWEPVRKSLVGNLLGYVPMLDARGVVYSPPQAASTRPLVTYISRQGGGRRLLEQDHQGLVEALRELESEGICEVNVVVMEQLSLRDQINQVARSTILLGVHGNGLTHQLLMSPSSLSATIEILIPEGYVFDYEILARNMGHKHYAIWNDTYITYPKGTYNKGVKYPPGFHGVEIPVYGPAVSQLIREHLTSMVEGV